MVEVVSEEGVGLGLAHGGGVEASSAGGQASLGVEEAWGGGGASVHGLWGRRDFLDCLDLSMGFLCRVVPWLCLGAVFEHNTE